MDKGKIIFVSVLITLLATCALAGTYSGGTGEPNDPYRIATAQDLNDIANHPEDCNKHFLLVADIDLSAYTGEEFNIIGDAINPFIGVFDGNDHTISDFNFVADFGRSQAGLFGYVGDVNNTNAQIKNLVLIEPHVDAGSGNNVGALVGYFRSGTVTRCSVQGGNISGQTWVGGLIGKSTIVCTIVSSASTADVSGSSIIGGLVGQNYCNISNSFSAGTVSGIDDNVGGLVGEHNLRTIANCYSSAAASGNNKIGGLVGYSTHGKITKSYSTGAISGAFHPGGLVGTGTQSDVTSSFWDTETSGQATSAGGTGKTTAEMKTMSTFTDAGWDFIWETTNGSEDIWAMCECIDYPKLYWQFLFGDFDDDGKVNFIDFAHLGSHWLMIDVNFPCDGTDLTGDNFVDLDDLEQFVSNWLQGF